MVNKFNFPKSEHSSSREHTPLMYIGLVESIIDKDDAGRIVVRIKGVDDEKGHGDELMEAFPLLPKMINVFPKIGEKSSYYFYCYFCF